MNAFKRLFAILCTLCLLSTSALADMGVVILGVPETAIEEVHLDNFKLNADVKVNGYAIFTGTSFAWADTLGHYHSGRHNVYYASGKNEEYESGSEADFAILKMDITNLTTKSKNYLESCEVKAIFDDTYEYGGWCYQYNYDNKPSSSTRTQNLDDVIDKADQFAIEPMYTGHFCFGCTLPNAVIQSKAPLRLVITVDGTEIVYYVRK